MTEKLSEHEAMRSYLITDPGGEVVRKLLDEIADLERSITALEKQRAAVYKEGAEAAVIAGEEIERLRARVAELEAKPCPYVETSDEGTSYCRLAESNPDHNTASAE